MILFLKNLLFTLVIPGTIGVYLPLWLGRRSDGLSGWWNWLGVPLLAFGLVILLLCIWDFWRKGEGTPFPLDPPKKLVTARLYQFTRNPMYVGVLIAIAGWILWYSSLQVLLYGLAVGLGFNLFVRFIEEPFLKKQFGKAYEEYCKKVPRWL